MLFTARKRKNLKPSSMASYKKTTRWRTASANITNGPACAGGHNLHRKIRGHRGFAEKGGVPHQVLNPSSTSANQRVVAQAGRKGAVTVATNMAGRGRHLLGGNPSNDPRPFSENKLAMPYAAAPAVIGADPRAATAINRRCRWCSSRTKATFSKCRPISGSGLRAVRRAVQSEPRRSRGVRWLHILGTERHEARAIDNQLRRRAGRQGDPGSSRFFLSLEDDLMRIFARACEGADVPSGHDRRLTIESGLISRRHRKRAEIRRKLQTSTRRKTARIRRRDEQQRRTIYAIRRSALEGKDQRDYVLGIAEDSCARACRNVLPREQHPDQWNTTQFLAESNRQFGIDMKTAGADPGTLSTTSLRMPLPKP